MSSGWFVLLSLVGILVGIMLMLHGNGGGTLGSGVVLFLGAFITVKEILDIAH